MTDYTPKDYEERMDRSKDFAIAKFLATGAQRVKGPSIVISVYRDGSMITVNTPPSMNPNSTNSDTRAFIPKCELKDPIGLLPFYAKVIMRAHPRFN